MKPVLRLLLLLALALPPAPAAADDGLVFRPLIANGVPGAWPAVGVLLTSSGSCTAVVVGCQTVVTAAHCVCDQDGTGAACADGEFFRDLSDAVVFLPQAGSFAIESFAIAPGYQFSVGGDIAWLGLQRPLRSVRPLPINETARPPLGTAATIVGYGSSQDGANDAGIQRMGAVTTTSCTAHGIPSASHVCWTWAAPIGPAGTDSNTCPGDSGGPLLVDYGAGPLLAGVHSGGTIESCSVPPSASFDTDVYVWRSWLRSMAGLDLDEAACGDGPQAGDAEVTTLGFAGAATASQTFHDFLIPDGIQRLRVSLNGETDPSSDLDLYVGLGARPTTSVFACSSTFSDSFESCEIAAPEAGSGHVLVRRNGAASDYQATILLLPEDPSPPPLPPGGAVVANFASFELLQVDPSDGRRAVVSSDLRGAGPPLSGPEGVALAADGAVLVANAFARNLLRVDLASGDRTIVSGCEDAACSTSRGAGPPFLIPRFVARRPDGAWLVADRAEVGVWALVLVDPATGDRSVLSGCADPQCSTQIGAGPAIGRLFGLAIEATGMVVVADGLAVYRIDPASGDRALLSGCSDPGCVAAVGSGPAFGEPVDLVVEPGGTLLAGYRIEGGAFGAIRRIDPVTGARTLVSGCEDLACASQRGAGPRFADLFGLDRQGDGALLASDAALNALLRVELETGDRTLVSGCLNASCSSGAGSGPGFGEPVDLLVVPEPGAPAAAAAALAALACAARRRR